MNDLAIRKITGRILIVDDERMNVRLLERMLQYSGCEDYCSTLDSRKVLDIIEQMRPDAILLDLNMPNIDGITLLGMIAERYPCRISMPVIVLTADATMETKHRALQAGASDFLTKPLDALEVVLRIGNQLRSRNLHLQVVESNALLESRVMERTRDLDEAQAEIIDRLAKATESRDDDTGGHVERVATMTAKIAEALGIIPEEVEILRRAVRLHDVGKIAVPDNILRKTEPLTADEYEKMREHAAAGGKILEGSRLPVLIRAEEIARNHHERWDGGGYPEGLREEQIPLSARIASVADVFDALTTERSYKRAWSIAAAAAEIEHNAGTQFDPRVVEAFLQVICAESIPSAPQPFVHELRRAA